MSDRLPTSYALPTAGLSRRTALQGLLLTAAALALPPFLRPAFAETVALKGDPIATSAGDVILHPVKHASLVIGFADQILYFDPVGGAALYAGLPKPTAIFITHAHPDHFDVPTLDALGAASVPIIAPKMVVDGLPASLKAKATEIANGASTKVAGIAVDAVAAYNVTEDRLKYHPKGVGNGYVLHFGDKTIYVAGDTEETPEMDALTGIDVAFLPMNLPYTMTEAQAAKAVQTFKPKIVYPYHYKGSDPKKFADAVGTAAEVRLVDWYKG
jgi:L-ascorbate metabolism protein UlaG (beta-lactamase superfamily)